MAADETNDTHQASGTAGTTGTAGTDQKAKLLRDADRMDNWSRAWIGLAMLAWGWFGYLLVGSYGPDSGGSCGSPLDNPFPESDVCRAAEMHQWPAIVGVLGLTVVLTVLAAGTTLYRHLLSRLAEASGSGRTPETGRDSA